jgi:hypothetical protein
VGDGGWWIEERGERSAGHRLTEMQILRKLASNTAYRNRLPRNVEWQNGGIEEWQNGRMAEWQKGGMAEWYFTTYLIYPAIFMVHADDADDDADDTNNTDGF